MIGNIRVEHFDIKTFKKFSTESNVIIFTHLENQNRSGEFRWLRFVGWGGINLLVFYNIQMCHYHSKRCLDFLLLLLLPKHYSWYILQTSSSVKSLKKKRNFFSLENGVKQAKKKKLNGSKYTNHFSSFLFSFHFLQRFTQCFKGWC